MPYHRKGYSVLTIKDLSITRGQGEQSFTVSLPHLSLAEGEVVSLCGSSGCGKSTLLEMMGLILKPDTLSQYELSSATLSEKLNINHLMTKYPKQLSIGERQRVAFVRSIAHKPLLLLADEPTSALDPHHSEVLFHLMLSLAKQQKIAVLLVTHDWDLVQRNELRTFSAKLDMSLRQSCFIEQANND